MVLLTRIIYFSILFFPPVCLPSRHPKEHPVLIFRFLLCHTGLNNVNSVCTVRDSPVAALRSYLFSYGEINEYIYFYLVIFTERL